MSWLSPKRRRTTGTLKTLAQNGQVALDETAGRMVGSPPRPGLGSAGRGKARGEEGRGLGRSISVGAGDGEGLGEDVLEGHFRRTNELLEVVGEGVRELVGRREERGGQNGKTLESVQKYFGEELGQVNGSVGGGEGEKEGSARLEERLERILGAVEEQSGHLRVLIEVVRQGQKAPVEREEHKDRETAMPPGFDALGERLDRIQDAMEESNRLAREKQSSASDDEVRSALADINQTLNDNARRNDDHMEQLLSKQDALVAAVEANGGDIDFTPLADLLDTIREASTSNADSLRALAEKQTLNPPSTKPITPNPIDLSPLAEELKHLRASTDRHNSHLDRLHTLPSSPTRGSNTKENGSNLDLTPPNDRDHHDPNTSLTQPLHFTHTPPPTGTGDAKFLLSALTSHLSQIQAVTDTNATQIRALAASQSAHANTHAQHARAAADTQKAVTRTSEALRTLAVRERQGEARGEAQQAQMRELMSGQREMVEVVRELARGVAREGRGGCGHVVVPPPRKMGRKVVGFVYDAKDAQA